MEVKMIKYLSVLFCFIITLSATAQDLLQGKILDSKTNKAISSATIINHQALIQQSSNKDGIFTIQANEKDSITISAIGYESQGFLFIENSLIIHLDPITTNLEEVIVNTGYYSIPKERATGSFVHIDESLLQRSPSVSLIHRLENVASGLQVERTNFYNETESEPKIRVRGVASINAESAPLIVLDGFPYDGNLEAIDPNSIESITFLKDAAAASIWGAQAGNGVIVIQSKTGSYNAKTRFQYISSFQVQNKPDLYYSSSRLPSETTLEIEDLLFEKNIYPEADNNAIPYYIELKYALQKGEISESYFNSERDRLKNVDFRDEALKYLYQKPQTFNQNLNISGGGNIHNYSVLFGTSNQKKSVIGNKSNDFSIQIQNGIKLFENLRTDLIISHRRSSVQENGVNVSQLSTNPIGTPSTYTSFMDEKGYTNIIKDIRWRYTTNAEENGLLDWTYNPVRDREHLDDETTLNDSRIQSTWSFCPIGGLSIIGSYQFSQSSSENYIYADKESYYVRNLVNKFTQEDGTLIIPNNSILSHSGIPTRKSHSGRLQLNYNKSFKNKHEISALGGVEIRTSHHQNKPYTVIYDYDNEFKMGRTNFDYTKYYNQRPIGGGYIPRSSPTTHEINERFLSYFSNLGYSFNSRFFLSGSMRWDASNLFGVNANQKGVPLWSIGGRWDLSKETFLSDLKAINSLSIRGSFGSNGNVNQSASALPIIMRGIDSGTGLSESRIMSVGNPSLRWEKVNTTNLGVDYSLINNKVSGGVDFYIKNSHDLLGYDYIDPTTGLSNQLQQMINYAMLRTKGIDLIINTQSNFRGIKWRTYNLFSVTKNKVVKHMTNESLRASSYITNSQAPPIKGKSLDVLYAYPWNGLSSETGLPIVYLDGVETTEYNKYINSLTVDDLENMGSRIPIVQASTRQVISYSNFNLGFLLTFKGNYVFRTNSMIPGAEALGNNRHHMDYFKRWKKPGDETITNVPANVETYDNNLSIAYNHSKILIEKGDHLRLQDISISHDKKLSLQKGNRILDLTTTLFINNIGIIWRANKKGMDPDIAQAAYPSPISYNFGINVNF